MSEDRALQRFLKIHTLLQADTRLNRIVLRYATILLEDAEGEAESLVLRLQENAKVLSTQESWLKHPIRFVFAASLMGTGTTVAEYCTALTEGHERFRKAGLRRGAVFEAIALLILQETAAEPVNAEMVARFKALYQNMKKHHWWLTGPDDYPFCALLTTRPGAVSEVGDRIESFYKKLQAKGFGRGNQVQLTSHILHFHTDEVEDVVSRFECLVAGLALQKQLWVDSYDEVALLCFLSTPIDDIIATLIRYAGQLSVLPHPPEEPSMIFSLATSITLRQLAQDFGSLRALAHAHALLNAAQAAMS